MDKLKVKAFTVSKITEIDKQISRAREMITDLNIEPEDIYFVLDSLLDQTVIYREKD